MTMIVGWVYCVLHKLHLISFVASSSSQPCWIARFMSGCHAQLNSSNIKGTLQSWKRMSRTKKRCCGTRRSHLLRLRQNCRKRTWKFRSWHNNSQGSRLRGHNNSMINLMIGWVPNLLICVKSSVVYPGTHYYILWVSDMHMCVLVPYRTRHKVGRFNF